MDSAVADSVVIVAFVMDLVIAYTFVVGVPSIVVDASGLVLETKTFIDCV